MALCAHLNTDDMLFYNHRGHGLNKCLPKGMAAKEILAEHFGRATGGARGFAGFHYSDLSLGLPGMGGMVGAESLRWPRAQASLSNYVERGRSWSPVLGMEPQGEGLCMKPCSWPPRGNCL